MPIDPQEFVQAVQPLLERKDPAALLCLIKTRWSSDQLRQLLRSEHQDARKVGLLALALVGERCCVPELAEHVKDRDPMVNHLAEHALWSIWFRLGTPQANHQLARGTQAITRRDFDAAIKYCSEAIALDPTFAEAYNQRAIAYYLQEKYNESIRDCRRTLELMPCHFGACAGMGHGHLHLGQLEEALEDYERALALNPHLDCVKQTVAELRRKCANPGD